MSPRPKQHSSIVSATLRSQVLLNMHCRCRCYLSTTPHKVFQIQNKGGVHGVSLLFQIWRGSQSSVYSPETFATKREGQWIIKNENYPSAINDVYSKLTEYNTQHVTYFLNRSFISPLCTISSNTSAPPTNSPFTYNCMRKEPILCNQIQRSGWMR